MSPTLPKVTDPLPYQFRPDFERLTDGLDDEIPARRRGRNILVATWNLREFGDLTEKWRSRKADKPLRDLSSLRLIAEVVSRFDVVALQEVQSNIKALRHLLKVLGPSWAFLLTDENLGREGQGERLAFLFDTRRAKPSGLACELVLPSRVRGQSAVREDALQRQFARTSLRRQLRELGADLHPRDSARHLRQARLGAHRGAAGNRALASPLGEPDG